MELDQRKLEEEYRKQAWDDLHRLTQDNNDSVRIGAAEALGSCYSQIPEEYRKQAWDDLIRLTQDKNDDLRIGAADVLGSCYSHIPEEYRKQAWDDLHRRTQDNNAVVRIGTAYALGSFYSHIPEEHRKQAWDDLIILTQDKDKDVRVAANHSSGRVSIYRASQAKGDESVRNELEIALLFFEKSSNEATYFNPAKFCLPFYRSFHAITFKKEEAEAEVKQYLAEAKSAIEGSKSKENLLEAVENLGNALKEAQKARDLNDVKYSVNAYRLYCDRAADMLDETDDKVPGAARLVRKGLPIIDERINGIIREIEEKTKALCKQTNGTPLEDLGQQVNRQGQALLQIRDPLGLEKSINNMQIVLSVICTKLPEERKGELSELLKRANDEQSIENKILLINEVLSKVSLPLFEEYSELEPPPQKQNFIDLISLPATIASFIGFIVLEILDIIPIGYDKQMISALVALTIFLVVSNLKDPNSRNIAGIIGGGLLGATLIGPIGVVLGAIIGSFLIKITKKERGVRRLNG